MRVVISASLTARRFAALSWVGRGSEVRPIPLTTANGLLYLVNMARRPHSKKQIQTALRYAEQNGWTVTPTKPGHRWGKAECGRGCVISIWSTPRNPDSHATQIRRADDKCPHD